MLKIYFTSDLHNHKNVFKTLEKLTRISQILLLDCGDAIGGNNYFGAWHEPILDMMGNIGYKAMAMGNREFNYSRKILIKRLKQPKFPILSCNLNDLRGQVSNFLKPYVIEKIDNFKICIIGLTPIQFSKNLVWTKITGFEFNDYLDSVRNCINLIKNEVNLIIVLSHIGLKDDIKLARKLNEEVIILGGHSHKVLKEPLKIDKVLIFHTGCYGKHVGEVLFTPEAGGELIFNSYNLLHCE